MDIQIRRALLSVSDKTGLEDLGRDLASRGVEILSTGGTARALRKAGIQVKDVSEETGFPEMMDGRVKTLHPRIHGALLGLRDAPDHVEAMQAHGIRAIDLVVVNLYPFEATAARRDATFEDVVEQIDIGGPSMVRSAAKNHRFVAVVTEPRQYAALREELEARGGAVGADLRRRLAREAFARTAAYDAAIARWLGEQDGEALPASHGPCLRAVVLRYGENPHQQAALYVDPLAGAGSLARGRVLGGKAISFNNYGDVDAAWALVREFEEPAGVVVKHANPCGAAVAATPKQALEAALECDPRSAFGGIVALNRPLTAELAALLAVPQRFLEVLIAPRVDEEAAAVFTAEGAPRWGKNLRIIEAGPESTLPFGLDVRTIDGGLLAQTRDLELVAPEGPRVVTKRAPTPEEEADLGFGWRVCKHVRSNAIVLAKGGQAVGVGAGQMSRVEAMEIAIGRARRFAEETGASLEGMVAASDAFFPFNDALEIAFEAGVRAVAQPGGSRNDERAVAFCDERGAAMWFTGRRHFRH